MLILKATLLRDFGGMLDLKGRGFEVRGFAVPLFVEPRGEVVLCVQGQACRRPYIRG